ncbi:phosphatase PAP2 family protein [Sulfuriflexus mobilis]|uniref:phosphatase PAP2 family protein n=1 Tax=Sulfuriflexus mobilis TaxID=1811807 RepID=UPI000F82B1C4|nr:phosphatase PAP2 family protein [Sulfuriflexus mobilis]
MFFEFIENIVKLSIIIACLYFSIIIYVRNKHPTWSGPLEKRRFTILLVLILAVVAIKISEDVLYAESGAFDKAVLLYIHNHLPASLNRFFEIITVSGSLKLLLPLTLILTLSLFYAKRRFEALLLASSVVSAAMIVYLVKTLVGRDRPLLWQTAWYWGSSFPSGHTLVVSAFATAAALCVGSIWPTKQRLALSVAMLWLGSVAFSRLVLGVHWPTDVLAAVCIGIFIPLMMNMLIRLRNTE